ncbi:DUF1810 domain-containing protein [Nocardioides nematodiphilus]|uniref:DUF1810 domain-containing protein n=1 Tax=Nocardioides nematodiphilus TaxID=2849669 RepID=UPI001CDA038D|nr:DUF1810 domain-containing protein [Nocardioides nematodiphilus]MCA1982778.1 DUF1810 domain-containing protein [Nocardioides nematodiphilus]
MSDDFDLDRFVQAQAGGVYEQALAELRAGRKRSHWIWFVFPQVAGLGYSPTSQRYAIGSLAEARAYLGHPVLGPRLRQSASAARDFDGTPEELLGPVDEEKLRSSMTLFEAADPDESVFAAVLDGPYAGSRCRHTQRFLAEHP